MDGGIVISRDNSARILKAIDQLEKIEQNACNIPVIFADMFKNEINANEEERLYNGIKRIIRKYSEDGNAISVINEFTRVITGGASLEEIIQITIDEAENPTLASILTGDDNC